MHNNTYCTAISVIVDLFRLPRQARDLVEPTLCQVAIVVCIVFNIGLLCLDAYPEDPKVTNVTEIYAWSSKHKNMLHLFGSNSVRLCCEPFSVESHLSVGGSTFRRSLGQEVNSTNSPSTDHSQTWMCGVIDRLKRVYSPSRTHSMLFEVQ